MLQLLGKSMDEFLKTELQLFQRILSPDYKEDSEGDMCDTDFLCSEEREQMKSSREALLKITLHYLRRLKEDKLANSLQSSKRLKIMKRQ